MGTEYVFPEYMIKNPQTGNHAPCPNYKIPTPPPLNQRHFSTGAVRDNATGKGRFDLLPWNAIHELARHCERGALHYGERNVDKGIPQHSLVDSAFRHLSQYLRNDPEPHHLVAACWNLMWALEQEELGSGLSMSATTVCCGSLSPKGYPLSGTPPSRF